MADLRALYSRVVALRAYLDVRLLNLRPNLSLSHQNSQSQISNALRVPRLSLAIVICKKACRDFFETSCYIVRRVTLHLQSCAEHNLGSFGVQILWAQLWRCLPAHIQTLHLTISYCRIECLLYRVGISLPSEKLWLWHIITMNQDFAKHQGLAG